jgi:putative ABC transport system permease protein
VIEEMGVPLLRRNLFHELGKLLLSIAGIGAAISLILLLLGFREGLYATLTAFADNLGADVIVTQQGVKGILSSDSSLPLSIHEQAYQASGAVEAGHILIADIIFTYGETKTPVLLVGYDPASPFGAPWKIGRGRNLEANNEIMLDSWLASRSGLQVGDQVEVLGKSFAIVGTTLETASWMSPYVFVSLPAAEDALALHGIVSFHLMRLPEGSNISQAKSAITAQIPGVQALTPDEIAQADKRVMATVMDTPLNVMLVIGTIIGAAVMGLTSYTSVVDRMLDFGILKAIGADGRWLSLLVLRETLVRSALGLVMGIGMALLSARIIMAAWPQFNIQIQPATIVLAGILTIVMTIPASLLPLQKLQKIDPLRAFNA